MKKMIALFVAIASIYSVTFAQDTAKVTNPNAPKIKFKDESHDFGTVVEGPSITYDFKFKNVGITINPFICSCFLWLYCTYLA